MKTLKISLVRSQIGCPHDQRATLFGLGLRKIGQTKELENTPAVRGMIKKVIHLLKVDEASVAGE